MLKAPTAPAGSPAYAIALMRDVVAWVRNLTKAPQPRDVYTITTLPSAVDFNGATVPVSNGVASPTVTAVNGVWTYQDNTPV